MSTTSKKNSQHVYDYAIIGSGLSGLCIASALSKVTSNIILLDSADTFGGFNRSVTTTIGPVNNGLRFLPASELSRKAITFLETLLGASLSVVETEIPPVTFEAGGIRPFVGFGDQPPAFYEELSYFTSPAVSEFSVEPHQWTQLLFNQFSGDFSPRSYVTKFHGENGQIQQLTINGQKKINVQNVIYCGSVKDLTLLLPEDGLSPKARGKLSKNHYWTAICLDLLHPTKITDSSAIHVLNGTTQDDLGPCVGRFFSNYSQWMTFVDNEEAEDAELIGAALKKIKRQIKRAYPDALENLLHERILVVPNYAGSGDLKLNGNQTLPNYGNFWIGSQEASPQKNILGALLQAELITSALGCHPKGLQIETSQDFAQDLEP
jgi:hypothetical protein